MEKQFKKGEYYVVLKDDDSKESNWTNYIFEQDFDSNCIVPIKRKSGLFNYGDQAFNYYNDSINWYRKATLEEIQHYKALGVPYDVTTLKPIVYKQDYTILLNILKYINNYGKI